MTDDITRTKELTSNIVAIFFTSITVLIWSCLVLYSLVPEFLHALETVRTNQQQGAGNPQPASAASVVQDDDLQLLLIATDRRSRSCTGCFFKVSERQQSYRLLMRHCMTIRKKRNLSTGLCQCPKPPQGPRPLCPECQMQAYRKQHHQFMPNEVKAAAGLEQQPQQLVSILSRRPSSTRVIRRSINVQSQLGSILSEMQTS